MDALSIIEGRPNFVAESSNKVLCIMEERIDSKIASRYELLDNLLYLAKFINPRSDQFIQLLVKSRDYLHISFTDLDDYKMYVNFASKFPEICAIEISNVQSIFEKFFPDYVTCEVEDEGSPDKIITDKNTLKEIADFFEIDADYYINALNDKYYNLVNLEEDDYKYNHVDRQTEKNRGDELENNKIDSMFDVLIA